MELGKEAAILFSVMFLPGLFTSARATDPSVWNSLAYNVTLLAVTVPQILLVVYVTNLRTPGFSRRLGWRIPRMRDLVSAGVSVGALVAAVGIWQLVVAATGYRETLDPAVNWSYSRFALLPLVVVGSLAVGYREEIFYRAYLYERAMELGVPPATVILVSTVLFASGHVYQGVAGFAVSFLVGAALGIVYAWRRSLHGAAVAHGLYNVAILVVSEM